ncbi:MAG: polyprenyl synthetase family protein [Candidatus Thorarchaeota archaeon]|nr:polyprenyl synthetase family protein [Candidatus Thorarchaeota archaeon]
MPERDGVTTEDQNLDPYNQVESSNGEMVFLNDLTQSEIIQNRLKIIDDEIDKRLSVDSGEPKILYETAAHLLKAGGKRLRSLLVVLSCEAVGGETKKAIPFAVATEFTQTASLIHDDVIDEDSLRRGVQSAHEKFGQKMAILAGDLLVAQAIRMIGSFATSEILVDVAEGGIRMCEGEAADMLMRADNPKAMTKKSYLEMIEKKTVAFIRAAMNMGASIGGGTPEQCETLGAFGENIGYAFQIRDDVLNIISSEKIAGKSVHTDLLSQRCSYPLVHALDSCSKEERDGCLRDLSNGDTTSALNLIHVTDAIPHAIELAHEYVAKAKMALKGYDFANESLLKMVADFILQRLH